MSRQRWWRACGENGQPGFYHDHQTKVVKDDEHFDMAIPMPAGGFSTGQYFVHLIYKGESMDQQDFWIVK